MQEYVSPNLSKGKIATRLRFVKSLMNEPQYFWNNLEAKWRSLAILQRATFEEKHIQHTRTNTSCQL